MAKRRSTKSKKKATKPSISRSGRGYTISKNAAEHIERNGAYFNSENRYKKGDFKSKKNQTVMTYRSSYEYAYMLQLESRKDVIKFVSEPFAIRYIDADDMVRNYVPDMLVLYDDGRTELVEVKPSAMLKAKNVRKKAAAARRYLEQYYPDTKYVFITEKHLFKTFKEYKHILDKL